MTDIKCFHCDNIAATLSNEEFKKLEEEASSIFMCQECSVIKAAGSLIQRLTGYKCKTDHNGVYVKRGDA